jgi:hypothetical protein
MIGGGLKSNALLHVASVDNANIMNANVIDQSLLKECEITFSPLKTDVIIDFLPDKNCRLGLSWTRVKKGESHASIFIVPGNYYYRFSPVDSTRNIGQKPKNKITISELYSYNLINEGEF